MVLKETSHGVLSSTEVEYQSMTMTTAKLMWVQSLLSELGIKGSTPPVLWCDNLGAIFLITNLIFHVRTKHIELNFHFVREQVVAKKLLVKFICSADQICDIFTRSLSSQRFRHLCSKLTLAARPFILRGAVEISRSDQPHGSSCDRNGEDEECS
jgi:hypothetical protein